MLKQEVKVPKIIRALPNFTEATAFIQNNYSCGFKKRCERRNWLEHSTRKGTGFRYMTRTSRPWVGEKPAVFGWSKEPSASTYSDLGVMILTDEHSTDEMPDHVSWLGLSVHSGVDELNAFVAAFGDSFSDLQKKEADALRVLMRAYKSVVSSVKLEVRDNATDELLFPEPITPSDSIFASSYPTAGIEGYNPPTRYLDEVVKVSIQDNHILGKRIKISVVSV